MNASSQTVSARQVEFEAPGTPRQGDLRERATENLWAKAELGGGETILVVEDEVFVRAVTAEVLRSAGYNVLTAQNAAEASQIYEQCANDVDLLLSDVGLPGEDGWYLSKRLQNQRPELQVLLVTGHAMQPRSALAVASEEFLLKPFSSEELLRKVRQCFASETQ